MEAHRILVVDDEGKMRRLLEMLVKNMGQEGGIGADGIEALACCDDATVDLILNALMMPGIDGRVCLRSLTEMGE